MHRGTVKTARVELGGNTINGPVSVTNNSGSDFDAPSAGPEIEANRISGLLGCTGNTPPPTNDNQKNTVRGRKPGSARASRSSKRGGGR